MTTDRRTRKRAARRDQLLDLAAELVATSGVDGLTMAALAEAADYAPASLYTYFSSRSALLAALQQRALDTLRAVAEAQVDAWSAHRGDDADDAAGRLHCLARLWAFSDLFLSAPEQHPEEFRLQQQLLVATDAEEIDDAAAVVPAAMAVLAVPTRLLVDAADAGAIDTAEQMADPLGRPVDGAVGRTLAWVVALNGALLTDGLATGLPTTGRHLGEQLTGALLRGWGADPASVHHARELSSDWVRHAHQAHAARPESTDHRRSDEGPTP
ncbi:MAG: TetR/AcrR family transcriptional regulator [Acidimicrobiia bacterium]|nr:TetR/AcrR family transcriptional regulator [Acidimicrobiia bacterium]